MKQIIATAIILGLTIGVYVEALAFEKPATPKTGAYISDIDTDWVELTIRGKHTMLGDRVSQDLIDRVFSDRSYGVEIGDLAYFACDLYKREAVYLSSETEYGTLNDGSRGFVVAIRFLFACAIPAGM